MSPFPEAGAFCVGGLAGFAGWAGQRASPVILGAGQGDRLAAPAMAVPPAASPVPPVVAGRSRSCAVFLFLPGLCPGGMQGILHGGAGAVTVSMP